MRILDHHHRGSLPRADIEFLQDIIEWAESAEDDAVFIALHGRRFTGKWFQGWWAGLANGFTRLPETEEEKAEAMRKAREDAQKGHCHTAYCLAGQAVTAAGYRLEYSGTATVGTPFDAFLEDGIALSADSCVRQVDSGVKDKAGKPILVDDGPSESINATAMTLLGITTIEASILFDGDNGIDRIKAIVNAICVDRGSAPVYASHVVFDREVHGPGASDAPGYYGDDGEEFDSGHAAIYRVMATV